MGEFEGTKRDPQLPRHVAVIMDGNGRWAQRRGMHRVKGHEEGAEAVRRTVRACAERGVEALTLFSFSTENWRRPEDEVTTLMSLLARYLEDQARELIERDIQLRAIGELDRLPEHVHTLLNEVTALSAGNKGLVLTLALSYGSRAELVSVMRRLASDVEAGVMAPSDIDESSVDGYLYTAGLPDPDLLIRTSGELRLSNFLLWQLAYAELYATEVCWPDFNEEHLDQAFAAYATRQRRYGRTSAQLQEDDPS
jgi:undecaprenyl diphosphate synthase